MQSYFAIDAADAIELNQLIFSGTQEKLNKEINSFAEHFENCSVSIDSLTKTYVALTGCSSSISQHKKHVDPDIIQSLTDTQQLLNQALSTCSKKENFTDVQQRQQAYLAEKQLRKKKMMDELRRESDRLDEHYAKKTRESIYKNLVGADQWSSIQQ
ncbi:hypothetical protein G6F56_006866 [Rhizopus delemar]|nr:hypothetical protein G6F56_006866 [Rhizopus delemar]